MQPDADLWSLVYVSTATQDFADDQLDRLLLSARHNNAARDITGMLAYHDRTFMQALEGGRAAVEALFERIEADPRHTGAIVLLRQALPERRFGDWSMAFRRLHGDLPQGFSGLMQTGSQAESFAGHGDRVHRLLQSFADTQLRRRR